VRLNTGWFSDRSVCYLAAGRPVVIQETGFTKNYGGNAGLLSFRSLGEIVESVKMINADYAKAFSRRAELRAKSSKRKGHQIVARPRRNLRPRLRSRLLFQHFASSSRLSAMKRALISSLRRFDCCIDIVRATERAGAFSFGSQFWPWRPSKAKCYGTSRGPRPVPLAPPKPNGPVQKSLVRITSTEVSPDYKAPWNAGSLGASRARDFFFVIDGNRIMTNAHVVSNSRYLTVERDGDPNKYPAKVLFVGHDCDLALITVDAPNFYKNMVPLKFGGFPRA